MALPSWTPSLPQVAAYIPGRTLVGAADGYGNVLATFDATTHPTAAQVSFLIADACAWVQVKVRDVDPLLEGSAAACAAVRTAGQIEQAYPDNTADANLAALLFTQATQMRDDLDKANQALTGTDPEDPTMTQLPVYEFPREHYWRYPTSEWDHWG